VDGELHNLTAHQQRKPLLGSGKAQPVAFHDGPLRGILVIATDGFCNYVKRPELIRTVVTSEFFSLPRKLLDLARPKSGELWDDVAIVVCRNQPRPKRPRQRYDLDSNRMN